MKRKNRGYSTGRLPRSPTPPGNGRSATASPALMTAVIRREFDVAYQERGLFVLTMHPDLTGHRSRAAALEGLIEYMKSKPGVWFATHEQVARHVRQ